MKLWQIIDTSGSMAESGKRLIAREVLRTISQYVRYNKLDFDLKYILAGEEMEEIETSLEDDFPNSLFKLSKKINVQKLTEKLSTLDGYILFLTDGAWEHDMIVALRRWQNSNPKGSMKIIQLVPGKMRISREFETFASEDVFAALDSWMVGGVQ